MRARCVLDPLDLEVVLILVAGHQDRNGLAAPAIILRISASVVRPAEATRHCHGRGLSELVDGHGLGHLEFLVFLRHGLQASLPGGLELNDIHLLKLSIRLLQGLSFFVNVLARICLTLGLNLRNEGDLLT